jgi:hypothetical protein
MKDYILLLVKYKSEKGSNYFPDENRVYNLMNECIKLREDENTDS